MKKILLINILSPYILPYPYLICDSIPYHTISAHSYLPLINDRCVNACGKLPNSSPDLATSSENKPR